MRTLAMGASGRRCKVLASTLVKRTSFSMPSLTAMPSNRELSDKISTSQYSERIKIDCLLLADRAIPRPYDALDFFQFEQNF
jgi:hypothetical protein